MSFQYSKVGVTALGIHLGNEMYRIGKGKIGTLIESFGDDYDTQHRRVALLSGILEQIQDKIFFEVANAVGFPSKEEMEEASRLVDKATARKENKVTDKGHSYERDYYDPSKDEYVVVCSCNTAFSAAYTGKCELDRMEAFKRFNEHVESNK